MFLDVGGNAKFLTVCVGRWILNSGFIRLRCWLLLLVACGGLTLCSMFIG